MCVVVSINLRRKQQTHLNTSHASAYIDSDESIVFLRLYPSSSCHDMSEGHALVCPLAAFVSALTQDNST